MCRGTISHPTSQPNLLLTEHCSCHARHLLQPAEVPRTDHLFSCIYMKLLIVSDRADGTRDEVDLILPSPAVLEPSQRASLYVVTMLPYAATSLLLLLILYLLEFPNSIFSITASHPDIFVVA